jgi:hypothetical protein
MTTSPPPAAEVRLTDETIQYLREQMKTAVSEGIASAINEETAEAFWSAGLNVLQKQAQQHAGRFVIGGLWGLARKLGLFLMLGGIVYAVGGWSALAGLAKTIFSGSPS